MGFSGKGGPPPETKKVRLFGGGEIELPVADPRVKPVKAVIVKATPPIAPRGAPAVPAGKRPVQSSPPAEAPRLFGREPEESPRFRKLPRARQHPVSGKWTGKKPDTPNFENLCIRLPVDLIGAVRQVAKRTGVRRATLYRRAMILGFTAMRAEAESGRDLRGE